MPLKNIANRVYVEAIDVLNNCRKTGIAATISVVIETDGTQSTIDAGASSGITEVGTTGVYMIPLTTSQMDGNTIAVITSTMTENVVMEKTILYTEGGKLDTTVGSRLATSGYTAPTTPPTAEAIATTVLGTNLLTVNNAAVGSLKTILLLQTNAKVEGTKLKVYETDGTTIHAQYDLITTADAVAPIVGIETTGE